MESLKEKIAATIITPRFLKEWSHPNQEATYAATFTILDLYFRGVKPKNISNSTIRRICLRIDEVGFDILTFATAEIHLQCWLWIGETIEKWMELAVEEEEYESAANLRKLLNSEYV